MKSFLRHIIFLSFIVLASINLLAEDKKEVEEEELKIKFPKALVKGTEVPEGCPNLEKSRAKGTAPATIKIPKGCSNVAFEKDDITSSKEDAEKGDWEYLTDGNADGGTDDVIHIKDGLQWVQINLEKVYEIHAIQAWHFHEKPRVYNDVIIQICNDEDFAEDVTTVFNNDHDNSAGLGKGSDKNYIEERYGKTIKVKGVKGQYVRFYSNGYYKGKGNHYCEVQVHAK